jgi:hypothetical protein
MVSLTADLKRNGRFFQNESIYAMLVKQYEDGARVTHFESDQRGEMEFTSAAFRYTKRTE